MADPADAPSSLLAAGTAARARRRAEQLGADLVTRDVLDAVERGEYPGPVARSVLHYPDAVVVGLVAWCCGMHHGGQAAEQLAVALESVAADVRAAVPVVD